MTLLLAASCGGSSKAPATAGAGSTTTAAVAPAASPTTPGGAAVRSPGGSTVEVTGIVGAVNAGSGLIEIDRLSGAAVRRIAVGPGTVMRRASGGTTTLGQIRPSDRIIARGTLNDRGDTLEATELTVQAVVPGAQPGG